MNILWLLTDEQRADSLACYGTPWAISPNLDALAAAGVRYSSAYTPSPVCVAARAAMITGLAPLRTGVLNNHLPMPNPRPAFATQPFIDAGWQTAGFGKHHYNHKDKAFETQVERTLDTAVHYFRYQVPVDPDAYGVVRYPSEQRPWILAGRFPGTIEQTAEGKNVADALAWLRNRDRDRPYLLRVSLNAPHTPVVAPAPFDTMIDPDAIDLPVDAADAPHLPAPITEALIPWAGTDRLDETQLRRLRQAYYGRCAFVDHLLGQLLNDIDLDDTMIVFCSDHGAHLGDHGFLQKQSLYEVSARVPLLLAGPGIPQGVVDTPVSLGSLLPTLLDLAGLEHPDYDYESWPTADDGAEPVVVSEIDLGLWGYRDGERYAMVRRGKWKLAGYPNADCTAIDGANLHDLEADPNERQNLVADPARAGVVQDLLAALQQRDAGIQRRG